MQFPIPITEVIHPINVNQDNISLNNEIQDCQKSIRKFKGEFDEPSILNEKEKVNCQINKAFPGIQINAESTIHPMESNSDTNKNIITSNYSKDFQINENGNPCNESSLNFAEGQNRKELYVINERGSFANHIPTLEDQQKDNNLNESNNLKTVVLSEQNINCPNNHNLISNEEIKKFQQDSSEYELTFPYRTNPSLTYEINNDHEFDESNFKVIEKYEETKDSNTGKIENRLVKRLLTFKEKILPVWASDFKNLYNYLNFQMKIDPKSIFGNLYATEIKNLKKSVFPNSRIKRGTSEFAKNSEETFNNNCREEIFTFNDIGIQNLEKNQIGKGDLNKINENVPTSEMACNRNNIHIQPLFEIDKNSDTIFKQENDLVFTLEQNQSSNCLQKKAYNTVLENVQANAFKEQEFINENKVKEQSNVQIPSDPISNFSSLTSPYSKSLPPLRFEGNENIKNNLIFPMSDKRFCIKDSDMDIISSNLFQTNPVFVEKNCNYDSNQNKVD